MIQGIYIDGRSTHTSAFIRKDTNGGRVILTFGALADNNILVDEKITAIKGLESIMLRHGRTYHGGIGDSTDLILTKLYTNNNSQTANTNESEIPNTLIDGNNEVVHAEYIVDFTTVSKILILKDIATGSRIRFYNTASTGTLKIQVKGGTLTEAEVQVSSGRGGSIEFQVEDKTLNLPSTTITTGYNYAVYAVSDPDNWDTATFTQITSGTIDNNSTASDREIAVDGTNYTTSTTQVVVGTGGGRFTTTKTIVGRDDVSVNVGVVEASLEPAIDDTKLDSSYTDYTDIDEGLNSANRFNLLVQNTLDSVSHLGKGQEDFDYLQLAVQAKRNLNYLRACIINEDFGADDGISFPTSVKVFAHDSAIHLVKNAGDGRQKLQRWEKVHDNTNMGIHLSDTETITHENGTTEIQFEVDLDRIDEQASNVLVQEVLDISKKQDTMIELKSGSSTDYQFQDGVNQGSTTSGGGGLSSDDRSLLTKAIRLLVELGKRIARISIKS